VKKQPAKEAVISICGEACKVTAYNVTKTTWQASGKYKGKYITGAGRTALSAIRDWENKANNGEHD
jgi:hypothetical protein